MFILNFSINPTGGYTTQQLYGSGQYVPSPFSISSVPMAYNGNGNDFAAQNPFWSSNSLDAQNYLSSVGLFPRRSSMSLDNMIGIMTGRSNFSNFNNSNSFNGVSPIDSMIPIMNGGGNTSFMQPSGFTFLDMARGLMSGSSPFSGSSMLDTSRGLMSGSSPFSGSSMLDMSRSLMSGGFNPLNIASPLDVLRGIMSSGNASGLSTNFATSRIASQFFPVMEAVSTANIVNAPLTTA